MAGPTRRPDQQSDAPVIFFSKVLVAGVTAGVMLTLLAGTPLARIAPLPAFPLQLRVAAAPAGCRLDAPSLARVAGLRLRRARASERPWRVDVQRNAGPMTLPAGVPAWRVSLTHPSGTALASRALVPRRDACAELGQLIAILLTAYGPLAEERARSTSRPATSTRPASTRPATRPSTRPTSTRPTSTRPTTRPAPPPATPRTNATARRTWRVVLGGGVSGLGSDASGVGLLRGRLSFARFFSVALQLGAGGRAARLANIEATLWLIEARALAGYRARRGAFGWGVDALAGARLTRGQATGLPNAHAESAGAFLFGAQADACWFFTRSWLLGFAAGAVFATPRAAFVIGGPTGTLGTLHRDPAPALELMLFVGWER